MLFFIQWVGITLSGVGDYEGNKKKIADAYEIKKSFEVSVDPAGLDFLGELLITLLKSSLEPNLENDMQLTLEVRSTI